jgi:hypothetical protein
MVFLGYKYVLLLDRVKAAAGQKHRWLLHSIRPPKVEGDLVTVENGKGRLFCKTLLPERHAITDNSGAGKEFLHLGETGGERTLNYAKFLPPKAKPSWRMGQGRVDVTPADEAPECVYLHVLFPTETTTAEMPECGVAEKGAELVVKVGELSYTFRAGE